MPERKREVISARTRDRLFKKLYEDPKFRDSMKKDWRKAVKAVGVDPRRVVKGTLTREEIQSVAQAAAWTITIVITARQGLEQIKMTEAVNFEARG